MKKIKRKAESGHQTAKIDFKFFLLILAIIGGANSFSQAIIDPGVYPEGSYTDPEMITVHSGIETTHASSKIDAISSISITPSLSESWPEGTWRQGYYNTYNSPDYADWYENVYSNHPLIRTISQYTLGYIHAERSLDLGPPVGTPVALNRALQGIQYLVDTQRPDGGFVFWRKRPGFTTANSDETPGVNTTDMFPTVYALKALSEGYWYKKCHLGLPAEEVKDAVILAADYVVDNLTELIDHSNANERGLAIWGLATAYKATGDVDYQNTANTIATLIMDAQFLEGDWTGGTDPPIPSIPLGGPKPIEKWLAGDFDGDGKDEVLQKYTPSTKIYLYQDDFELGINNIYPGTQELEMWLVGNFDGDPADEVLHKFVGSPYIFVWNYGDNFGVNSVYTGVVHLENWICGDFDDDGVDEVLQKYTGLNTIYLWGNGDSFGSNSIYSGGATLENWLVGNFDADDNIEVLQKYNGTTIYLWNDGATFGANSIYTGPKHIQNWIASDFDDDGKDEVLQKYAGSTNIYLWDEAYSFGTNSVYTGPKHIEAWLAGDFDGDGKDEVIQKYVGSTYIYEWNYGTGFNASKPYEGAHHSDKWIVVNWDGGLAEELFQIFVGSDRIYYWEDDEPTRCMGCYAVFNLPEYEYRHDSRMQYHFFALGGLIETYSIATGSNKDRLAETIKKAVNHIIVRLDLTDPSKMCNYYYDVHRNIIPLFVREKYMYNSREAIQQLPQLAYYASTDPTNFTTTDINRIINLGNRMVNPDLPGYSYYKDYMNAINNETYLDYYGGCVEGVFLPVIDKPYDEHVEPRGMANATDDNTVFIQNVYPNPVHDILNISDSKSFVYAEVYNAAGMLISTHNSTKINLEDLAGGTYMIKVYRKSEEVGRQDDLNVQTEIIVKE